MADDGDIDAKYNCAICQDVLDDPRTTPCGHSFCSACLATALRMAIGRCPVCRAAVPADGGPKDRALAAELARTTTRCRTPGCAEVVALARLRAHETAHGAAAVAAVPSGTLKLPPGVTPPPSGPNRSTFACPYCDAANLTTKDLLEHVRAQHSRLPPMRRRVVCPICKSLPYGDPTLRSNDFNAHLETRHRFEMAEFIDMERGTDDADEEALFRSILEKSKHDR
jgi:hypothetical protein